MGFKLLLLCRSFTRPFHLSYYLCIFRTSTGGVVGNHIRLLTSRVGSWHGIVDIHVKANIWDEPRFPAGYRR